MEALRGVTDLKDILYDLEGSERREAQVRCVSTRGGRRLRDLEVRPAPVTGTAVGAVGEQFVARRPPELRGRYHTLFMMEGQFGPADEYAFLIGPACQVLETELNALLAEPARARAADLAAALAASKDNRKQAPILEEWGAGRVHTTIGIASLVLLALRRGLEQESPAVGEFLDDHFRPGFRELLRGKALGSTLDRVRETYRNPACHGFGSFGPSDYEAFARFVVANDSFGAWRRQGPRPGQGPPGEVGLLHHHLQESRLVPEAPEAPAPLARLLALAAPRASTLEILLEPHRVDQPQPLRDLTPGPVRLDRPFRLGDTLRFAFRANRDCHVALIDVGTTGRMAVVLPNLWWPQALVRGGQLQYLPGLEFPEFEFTLSGQPGLERVVALATEGEPPIPLGPKSGEAFRALTDEDVAALADAVGLMPPSAWAACVCEFSIAERTAG
jgi:hypothetical protein